MNAQADVIIGHGMAGFSMTAATAKAVGANNTTCRVLGFVGGFIGMLPDLGGAYGNMILHDNWKTYHQLHSGTGNDFLRIFPQYSLHIAVDALYHEEGGGWNWKRWPLFTTIFIIEAVLTYLIWQWTGD
jgi:hypothetical protein